ncbi:hypothetical protein [Actinomadura madurae]|uniref:hypothetical protein n=1 Tax=Actinomadura madurae TaxID=1993 RepID=UPI0020D23F3D|nr:hypothetical protein [Actinomadura madurae]MCP9979867.1 hypothetical protein [Actinomadura madurae]
MIAVVAVNSSRAATTSRCTSDCVPPASGTRAGTPTPRTPAYTSTATHAASWSQASHTSATRIAISEPGPTRCVRSDADGTWSGSGEPKSVSSANGTPAISAASATSAPMPAMTSPALRRPLTRTGVLCPCRVTIAPLPFSGPRTSPSS